MSFTGNSVALVEDNEKTRHRLEVLLTQDARYRLAFSVDCLRDAYAALSREVPAALLVDLGLPDGSGLDLIRYVVQRGLQCQVLVISVFGDDDKVFECIEAGASGYLIKGQGDSDLAEHLEDLFAGGSPVSPRIARRLITAVRHARMDDATIEATEKYAAEVVGKPEELTLKEFETLNQLALGYSYQEVAQRMNVTVNTVRFHIKSIYSKLYVCSRSQAIYEANRRGWITAF